MRSKQTFEVVRIFADRGSVNVPAQLRLPSTGTPSTGTLLIIVWHRTYRNYTGITNDHKLICIHVDYSTIV